MANARRVPLGLLLVVAAAYAATNYGGIRSSDAEVVFRVSQSIADRGSFALEHDLEDWHGFGVAPGRGGRLYAIYPPLQSILAVPFVWAGEAAQAAGLAPLLGPVVPPSHFAAGGGRDALTGRRPADPAPHLLRFFASWFNLLIGVLGAWVFWRIVLVMTSSRAAANGWTVLYALGTLLWPYADTFFTEPLATFWVLLSFLLLIRRDPVFAEGGTQGHPVELAGAGAALGLACATHLTAGLFVPFFLIYAGAMGEPRFGWRKVGACALGLLAVLALLGLFNAARFGSPFEDGRSLSVMNANLYHAPWTRPYWTGLWGQLVSAHKGILFLSPAVVLGALGWRRLRARHRTLAWLIAGMAAGRLLFIAAFNSWDAGFCIGPRYLVMLIPFLLLPATTLLDGGSGSGARPRRRLLALAALLCILQQFYFCSGEIFTYYHDVKTAQAGALHPLTDRTLYLDWSTTPLFHLLDHRKGPWLFQAVPLPAFSLWAAGAVLIAGLFLLAFRRWERSLAPPPPKAAP